MPLPTYFLAFIAGSLTVSAMPSTANELDDMASEAVKSSFSRKGFKNVKAGNAFTSIER